MQANNVVQLKTANNTASDPRKECISKINQHVKDCIDSCQKPKSGEKFFQAEKRIIQAVYQFGLLLLQLYLISAHLKVDYDRWLKKGEYYLNTTLRFRTLKTFFGEVSYGRCYLARKTGEGGIFALDKELGLTRDGFSRWLLA